MPRGMRRNCHGPVWGAERLGGALGSGWGPPLGRLGGGSRGEGGGTYGPVLARPGRSRACKGGGRGERGGHRAHAHLSCTGWGSEKLGVALGSGWGPLGEAWGAELRAAALTGLKWGAMAMAAAMRAAVRTEVMAVARRWQGRR